MPRLPRIALPPMRPRDPHERGRGSSPLEAFVDLVFVVAVSLASGQLSSLESDGHLGIGIIRYLMVFFALWWAWMNYTWFATSFDTDDWLYRVMTFVQMAGALVMAAGAPAAMNQGKFTVVVIGYVIMRLAMVAQWLRAAVQAPEQRRTALGYAIGIAIAQSCWVAGLWLGMGQRPWLYLLFVLVELSVPVVAQRAGEVPRNADHIAERHGLFTLIVLGESVLASTNAVVDAVDHVADLGALIGIAGCGLVLAAGMWWTYFSREHTQHFGRARDSIRTSYFHFVIFASAGAFSAGIESIVKLERGEGRLDVATATGMTTVPVTLFVLSTWVLTLRTELPRWANVLVVLCCLGIAGSPWIGGRLWVPTALMVLIVVSIELAGAGARSTPDEP